jgi:flagellar biosynthetic protein FlhB
MADGPSGDRTEKASPKRRQEARRKGQVARSQELNAAVVLLAGISLLLLGSGRMGEILGRNASYLLGQSYSLRPDNVHGLRELIGNNLRLTLESMGPLLGILLLAGVGVNVLQVGLHFSSEAVSFKFEKLNPVQGFKRFFSKRSGFELFKNLLKIGLIGLVAYGTVSGLVAKLLTAPLLSLGGAADVGRSVFAALMYKLLALMAVLAILDWSFQKWQHEENLKMTKTEVKQENKDLDGDPQIKARIRSAQFEAARRRMMADVPRADVVVTNPDHLAIALHYETGAPAPRVLAKGRNHLAETIKKIARQARVPVIENKPVTRALYPQVKVGGFIPENLYQAVAEILAYVYRLRKA